MLACETKGNGQPRFVRTAITRLQAYMYGRKETVTPVLLAPYLSPDSQRLCVENNIYFLDKEGNARLQFGGVYIDHRLPGKPVPEKRGLRTMFSPKSAQVLRLMLKNPLRTWRVTELSEEGKVSLGHASNVRKNLLEREWAMSSDDGFILDKPDVLVNAWRDHYRPIAGTVKTFYTPLHGKVLESQLRDVLNCDEQRGKAILASFSAAQWLSPYARTGMHFFLANEKGLEALVAGLKLSPSSMGPNVTVTVPDDEGIFLDTIEPEQGILTTGVVQTYLDLTAQGERGQEAAEHLRKEWMAW
ncbi:hypothetical protein LLP99_22450 [Rouxiella badensis]|nr:hypothetical protein [Rouxiella badensis]MCC3731073.1 hypothetical protein [Rouxiella badensis]